MKTRRERFPTLVRRVRPIMAATLLLPLVGCAAAPRPEYRAGVFMHENPRYSFRVPDGWRHATLDDVASSGYTKLALQWRNEAGKRRLLQNLASAMEKLHTSLISGEGAVIALRSTPNREGLRISSGSRLSEKEKEALSENLAKHVREESGGDAALESVDLVQYGPNPALRLTVRMAGARLRALAFVGETHAVAAFHVGTPADDDEGLSGLEELARSFHFD